MSKLIIEIKEQKYISESKVIKIDFEEFPEEMTLELEGYKSTHWIKTDDFKKAIKDFIAKENFKQNKK